MDIQLLKNSVMWTTKKSHMAHVLPCFTTSSRRLGLVGPIGPPVLYMRNAHMGQQVLRWFSHCLRFGMPVSPSFFKGAFTWTFHKNHEFPVARRRWWRLVSLLAVKLPMLRSVAWLRWNCAEWYGPWVNLQSFWWKIHSQPESMMGVPLSDSRMTWLRGVVSCEPNNPWWDSSSTTAF